MSDFIFFSSISQVSSLSQLSAGLHMAPTTAKQNTLIKPTRALQPKYCIKMMSFGKGGVPIEFGLICSTKIKPYRKFSRCLTQRKKMLKLIKYLQCTEERERRQSKAQPPEMMKFRLEQLLTQELKSLFLPLQKFFVYKGLQHLLFLFYFNKNPICSTATGLDSTCLGEVQLFFKLHKAQNH